ncbi:MAG: hypothetical protein PHU08_00260 [Dehalococcoidales bacterium]|nr:hypothetical protein [Dehalococcoidales bacterium]
MVATANVLVGTAEITLGVGVSAVVIGYTVDGVNMTVRSSFFDAKVDENEGTIIRRLTDQEVLVTLNVAEGAIANLAAAIPGSDLTGAVLTVGGSALQAHRLTLKGINPAGYPRVIILTSVNPTGEVTTPYKKGEVTVVPMQFSALVADAGTFGTVLDAAAVAPTLLVGASTKSNAAGTIIEAKFSANMATPVGKHLEFWFTEADFGSVRAFSAAALNADITIINLTVSGVAITAGKALALYYRLGSVTSAAVGVLASFTAQAVVARP